MRLPLREHHEHDWRVSTLASDFTLLDVWRFPIEIEESRSLLQFAEFVSALQRDLSESSGAAGALFRLRRILGKVFKWDDKPSKLTKALPIPGCV